MHHYNRFTRLVLSMAAGVTLSLNAIAQNGSTVSQSESVQASDIKTQATLKSTPGARGFIFTLENQVDPVLGAPDEWWVEISTSNDKNGGYNTWSGYHRHDHNNDDKVIYITPSGCKFISAKAALKWNSDPENIVYTSNVNQPTSLLKTPEVVDIAMLQRGAKLKINAAVDETSGSIKKMGFTGQGREYLCDSEGVAIVIDHIGGFEIETSYWTPFVVYSYNGVEHEVEGKKHAIMPLGLRGTTYNQIKNRDRTKVSHTAVWACRGFTPDESWGPVPPVIKARMDTKTPVVLNYNKDEYEFGHPMGTESVKMADNMLPNQWFALYYIIEFPDNHKPEIPSELEYTRAMPCKATITPGPTSAIIDINWTDDELNRSITKSQISYTAGNKYMTIAIEPGQHTYCITGLDPKTAYTPSIDMQLNGKGFVNNNLKFTTSALTLKSLSASCHNLGSAILQAETNIDSHETAAGFQYRRNDAPASMAPYFKEGKVYDKTMQTEVSNLITTSFYDMRAYYKSVSGKEYFGDWITFDPMYVTNMAPEVHTYNAENISHSSATLRGYVIGGSAAIEEQGFEYWKSSAAKSAPAIMRIKSELGQTVTGKGQLMTADIDNLADNTDYSFRTYVVSNGNITFGETRQFKTMAVSGINDIDADTSVVPVAYYTTGGVKVDNPAPGLYVVIYSDGSRSLELVR